MPLPITIEDIEEAQKRIESEVIRTPLLINAQLNERVCGEVFLKAESLQHIGAFKFRGAFNRLLQFSEQQKEQGVVAYSSGNHAQGVAYAAKLLGISATIVMPHDAPAVKVDGTRRLGATIRIYDRYTESREDIAQQIALETGATLVPAFDDPSVMAGQGTCGLEIVQQFRDQGKVPDYLLVPCSGGGLLAGVSLAVTANFPATRILGVEPEGFDDHGKSWRSGKRQTNASDKKSICDALLAPTPGVLTWQINSKTADGFLAVTDDEVAHAISFAQQILKLVIEPGGAVTLAALLQGKIDVQGKTICIILSGGNIDSELLSECLKKYPSP